MFLCRVDRCLFLAVLERRTHYGFTKLPAGAGGRNAALPAIFHQYSKLRVTEFTTQFVGNEQNAVFSSSTLLMISSRCSEGSRTSKKFRYYFSALHICLGLLMNGSPL